jgi:hypothetical protein
MVSGQLYPWSSPLTAESASYATLAQTLLGTIESASYAKTASYAANSTAGSSISSSWASSSVSASYALTASYSPTAGYVSLYEFDGSGDIMPLDGVLIFGTVFDYDVNGDLEPIV